MSLTGKVALVTGAAQGLGRAFSEALLRRGAKVCLTDLQTKQGEATASALQQEYGKNRVAFIKCDVTSVQDFERAFDVFKSNFGCLDIMVNNAGIGIEDDYVQTVNTNLTGVITGTNLAIRLMSKENGGHGGLILNIASTAGITPVFFFPVYTASKYGVVGFTRAWAKNPYLKKMGLRFACLCPAFTDTNMIKNINTLYPADAQAVLEVTGINKVETVTEAFVQLVENEDCNGAVVTVTRDQGIQYHRKPPTASRL